MAPVAKTTNAVDIHVQNVTTAGQKLLNALELKPEESMEGLDDDSTEDIKNASKKLRAHMQKLMSSPHHQASARQEVELDADQIDKLSALHEAVFAATLDPSAGNCNDIVDKMEAAIESIDPTFYEKDEDEEDQDEEDRESENEQEIYTRESLARQAKHANMNYRDDGDSLFIEDDSTEEGQENEEGEIDEDEEDE